MQDKSRKISIRLLTCVFLLIAFVGCTHSHVIQVTVTNTSAEKITTVVIDYPEATFGANSLDAGKSFQHKIKPTATGALKIEFVNSHGVDRVSTGPVVHKGDEGSIEVKLTQYGASITTKIK